ncbi:unnamed protein product [Brachionus calyciflorus]|uniref:Uncharacterized protein n=1 Tax=Brachionus calyciflorus TaxID=104777 RepID=A0A813PW23_9BILA|nr:unnamed protein product [Brachionus calyciflorus]
MVQGKLKVKASLPKNVKQKSSTRVNKAIEKSKTKIQKKANIQNIIKNNLETTCKTKIESDLCSRAKTCEGKSFRMLK